MTVPGDAQQSSTDEARCFITLLNTVNSSINNVSSVPPISLPNQFEYHIQVKSYGLFQ